MAASSQRAWQGRLALMVMLGVAAAAACALALTVWWKAPAASAQEAFPGEASFVVRCDFSHRNNDDPIFHPGQRGAAHRHDFLGNRSTNYASTYESLRAATATTCFNPADTAAYWIPTVKWTNSSGTRTLTPSKGLFYYRTAGKASASIQPHPAGLKVIPRSHVSWRCLPGTWSNSLPTRCSEGKLVVRIDFPDCSDGRLDSDDHLAHMAYSVLNPDGTKGCPSTHPTPVPALNTNIHFSIPTTSGRVTLSSGDASTMHADFFNAWDQAVLARLVSGCINAAPFSAAKPKPAECTAI
jgi:hypothetical protein